MNAVIYARYSSSNQREESIEGQIRECTKYAEQQGYTIINHYIDRAITGKTDNRPAFQQMIKESNSRTFNIVLCYKVDRFARNRYASAIYKSKLKKNGITVEYAKEHIPDTPEGIILESMLEGFAEYYSANLGVNTKRGKYENALKKKSNGGVTPIGYKRINGSLVIDEVKAPVVQFAFQSYIDGISYANIIKKARERYGIKLSMSGLKLILQNEVYTGKYIYNTYDGETFIYEDNHEAIVSRETYEKAKEKRLANKRSPNAGKGKIKYALSGLINCGECGGHIIVSHSYKKGEPAFFRLYCLNRKEHKNCNNPTRKMEIVENAVIEAIKNKILDRKTIKTLAEKACSLQEDNSLDKLKEFQTELKNVQKSKNNIIAAIEQGIITPTTKDRLQELEHLESDLQVKIATEKKAENKNLTAPEIEKFLKKYCSGNMQDETFRFELTHTFVKEILLFKDRFEITLKLSDMEIKETVEFE